MDLPADIANQALDSIGRNDASIGDLQEGSKEAQVLLRAYGQCLRQLLRGANWDFARKQAPLHLLADATGQTPNVGNVVPIPWTYEYEYPIDCMKARFVPWNYAQAPGVPPGNIQITTAPLMAGLGTQSFVGQRLRPSRFLIATDFNYPPPAGAQTWEVQGVSPQGRTVVLSNVQNATLIYTALMLYPSVWDALFRAAMVAYLASEIAVPLATDIKVGMALRAAQIQIVKAKLTEARIADGNEGFYSSDIRVDWMSTRNSGGPWGVTAWGDGAGPNAYGGGWDSCSFADGTAY